MNIDNSLDPVVRNKFEARFTTFEMQNGYRVIFFLKCFRKKSLKKQFLEHGVWTAGLCLKRTTE